MSDTINVTMPDGVVVHNVPRNITQGELQRRYALLRRSSPEALARVENERELAADTAHPGMVGFASGLKNAGEGVVQGVAALGKLTGAPMSGFVDEASRRRVAEEHEKLRPLTDRSVASELGRFVGEAGPAFAFPTSRGGALARFATDAVAGAGQGAIAPLEPGQSRLTSTLGGAAGAAVPSGAINTARALRSTGGHAQSMSALSEKYGVDLTAGELSGRGGLLRTETLMEKVPFVGIGGFRVKQSAQVQAAAKKLRDQFDVGVSDIGEELQSGLERVYNANKTEVGRLYDRVDSLSKGVKEPVIPSNRKGLAAELLKEETALGQNADQSLVKYLESHVNGEPLSFDAARKLRSRLWEDARKAEKQSISGSVSDAELRLRTRIAQAAEQDIDEWAERAGQQNQELLNAYRLASREFKDKVAPFKDRDIRRALETDDTDTIVGTFLKRDRPKLAEKLLSKTDERAQTATKFAILSDAFRAAESLPDVEFSPLVFARELERLKTTNRAIFSQTEQKELQGFVKLMHVAQRAGKYRENVPTGNRAVEAGALAGVAAAAGYAASSPWGAAALLGGAKSLSLLLTTTVGRSILTDVSRATPDSPAMRRLLLEGQREVARITGAGIGSELAR